MKMGIGSPTYFILHGTGQWSKETVVKEGVTQGDVLGVFKEDKVIPSKRIPNHP